MAGQKSRKKNKGSSKGSKTPAHGKSQDSLGLNALHPEPLLHERGCVAENEAQSALPCLSECTAELSPVSQRRVAPSRSVVNTKPGENAVYKAAASHDSHANPSIVTTAARLRSGDVGSIPDADETSPKIPGALAHTITTNQTIQVSSRQQIGKDVWSGTPTTLSSHPTAGDDAASVASRTCPSLSSPSMAASEARSLLHKQLPWNHMALTAVNADKRSQILPQPTRAQDDTSLSSSHGVSDVEGEGMSLSQEYCVKQIGNNISSNNSSTAHVRTPPQLSQSTTGAGGTSGVCEECSHVQSPDVSASETTSQQQPESCVSGSDATAQLLQLLPMPMAACNSGGTTEMLTRLLQSLAEALECRFDAAARQLQGVAVCNGLVLDHCRRLWVTVQGINHFSEVRIVFVSLLFSHRIVSG